MSSMNNVRSYTVNGQEVWQGRSGASGFRTRIFLNERDAIAEEKWLDDRWLLMRTLWEGERLLSEEMLIDGLRQAFFNMVAATGIGCYPVFRRGQPQAGADPLRSRFWETTAPSEEGVQTFIPGRHAVWGQQPEIEEIEVIEPTNEAMNEFIIRQNAKHAQLPKL